MGFFDFLGPKTPEKILAKHRGRALNKRAHALDRMESLRAIAEVGSPEAVDVLLERLTFRCDPSITDQEVTFSASVRNFTMARVFFPSALGACDIVGGDIALFRDTGILEPHVIAHEFCHRIGYHKELHAQVLGYLALRTADDPILVQAARAERLLRHAAVLSGGKPGQIVPLLEAFGLSETVISALRQTRPAPSAKASAPLTRAMRTMYEQRMRLTGQNGLSDYDAGFTSLLWGLGQSETARQPRHHAAP